MGTVTSISGTVDLDEFNGDAAALQAFAAMPSPAPDAGVSDAGVPDASTPDAGGPGATADAGSSPAGAHSGCSTGAGDGLAAPALTGLALVARRRRRERTARGA